MKRKISLFLWFTLIAGLLVSDPVIAQTKAQKKAEQKKEEQKKRSAKAEEQGKKRHRKLQTKDVQKRMKRNKKRYHHVDSFDRRPGFWQRMFPRKKPSAY